MTTTRRHQYGFDPRPDVARGRRAAGIRAPFGGVVRIGGQPGVNETWRNGAGAEGVGSRCESDPLDRPRGCGINRSIHIVITTMAAGPGLLLLVLGRVGD